MGNGKRGTGNGMGNGFNSRKVREVFYSCLFLLHICELNELGVSHKPMRGMVKFLCA